MNGRELRNKNVLIFGSEGFIGSHLVERLLKEGCSIRAFVLYNSFNSWGWLDTFSKRAIRQIEVFSGDVRDNYRVRAAVKGIDVIFNLAALISIPYSYYTVESFIDTNIKGLLNILEAARDNGVSKIIHTSTSEIYGTAQFIPITEDHPVNPQSPYAATKVAADFLALSFYRSFGVPAAIVRPFNTFGPRQSARAVVPTIITQILDGKRKIKLGSLSPTRDLTYVEDTVSGFIKAAQSESAVGQITNLGTGTEISIKELALLIAKLLNVPISFDFDKQRKRPEQSEVERLCADNSKAQKLLGWLPRYTLEQGLKETIAWFRKNRKLYKSEEYNI